MTGSTPSWTPPTPRCPRALSGAGYGLATAGTACTTTDRRAEATAAPNFGAHVSIGSREHQDKRVDEFGIEIAQETTEDDVLTADQARRLASHVIAAAQWMEAHA